MGIHNVRTLYFPISAKDRTFFDFFIALPFKDLVWVSPCRVWWLHHNLTFFPLLHLECEVESANGEVDSLWVGLADRAQEVENMTAFLPHQARQ